MPRAFPECAAFHFGKPNPRVLYFLHKQFLKSFSNGEFYRATAGLAKREIYFLKVMAATLGANEINKRLFCLLKLPKIHSLRVLRKAL
jgi:hypothetical protein